MTCTSIFYRACRLDRNAVVAAFCAIAFLMPGVVSGVASAQTSNTRQPTVETIASPPPAAKTTRNVYQAGSSVRHGTAVDGDFVAAGGKVVVDQPVKGDVMAVGGSVDIRGAVGDDVRAAGGDVTIESTIGGELFASGGSITLAKAARIVGPASLYGGTVVIDGKVEGPLTAGAQKIMVNGELNGETRFRAEQIEIGIAGRINGPLSYSSPNELRRAEGATVTGAITRVDGNFAARERDMNRVDREWHLRSHRGGTWAGTIFTFFALLACSAVLLLVFPVFSKAASDAVWESPWLALAIGFGAMVAVPILAVLLFVSVLGIPLGIIVLALYPALLLMGYVVGVLFVARRAQSAIRKEAPDGFAAKTGFFALALLLVMLMSRLPFVGSLVVFVVTVLGVGASVLEVHSRRQKGPPAERRDAGNAQMVPASA